ncbi:MAG: hypothetical protein RJA70_4769 [Pseudomonadota bacterium]|jgi:putative sterol carrier protein
MSTARDVIGKLQQKLQQKQSEAKEIDATYRFTLQGDGGGTWLLNLKDAVGISESDGPAECTITVSASDFVDLFEGRANGQQLFFGGKLRIEGDMSLALKLQKLTELMR